MNHLLFVGILAATCSAMLDPRTTTTTPVADQSAMMQLLLSLETEMHTMRNTIQQQEAKLQQQDADIRNLQNAYNNVSGSLSSAHKVIAFEAKLSASVHGSDVAGQILKFDRTITNVGNAYSTNTGVFHAPVDGLYLFSLTNFADGRQGPSSLEMYQNGKLIARPMTSAGQLWMGTSETAVVTAVAGDEFYVKTDVGLPSAIYDHMSRFSGLLVHGMP